MLSHCWRATASTKLACQVSTGLRSPVRTALWNNNRCARYLSSSRSWRAAAAGNVALKEDGSEQEPQPDISEPERLTFQSLNGTILNATLKAITTAKLTHMTPVQEAVLPMLPGLVTAGVLREDGKPARCDLLVRAKTGTGKTLAFLVPAIEARVRDLEQIGKQALESTGAKHDRYVEQRSQLDHARKTVGTLIISPTRELATQIADEAMRLSRHHDGFGVQLFVGGMPKGRQMRQWANGRKDILVTTPGRILDFMHSEPSVRDAVKQTKMLVLDEADTLLDMGFRDDIDAIVHELPERSKRQTFLFSATVNRRVEQIARETLNKDHMYISTVTDNASPVHQHIPQYHTVLPSAADQLPHVLRLLAHDQLTNAGHSKTLIFLPTTKLTMLYASLIRELSKSVLPAGRQSVVYEIHSKKTQEYRSRTSERFRADKSGATILVSSDVSARGVDYPGVTRVIQVGIPSTVDQYVHRVGRTGRAGNTEGRGDLVLLPWEVGFASHQMKSLPLKPVTVSDLEKEVTELATKSGTGSGSQLSKIDSAVESLLSSLDPMAIEETMASMLGYYASKVDELRCSRDVIVEGCKQWTVEACGLSEPPYISASFLQKIGAGGNRGRSGKQYGRSDSRGSSGPNSWSQRGGQNKPILNDDYSPFKSSSSGSGGYGRRSDGGSSAARSFGYGRSNESSYGGRGRSSGGRDSSRSSSSDYSRSSGRRSESSFGSR